MWLRFLVPFTLLWPVLALAAEGTTLRRYRATPFRELGALLICVLAFSALWIALDAAIRGVGGSDVVALLAATLLALLATPILLFLAYRLFGVKAASSGAH